MSKKEDQPKTDQPKVEAAIHLSIDGQKLQLTFQQLTELNTKIQEILGITNNNNITISSPNTTYWQPLNGSGTLQTTYTTGGSISATETTADTFNDIKAYQNSGTGS